MKAAVLGTGYVASAYLRMLHNLGYHPLVLSRRWLHYLDYEQLRFCLEVYRPDYVINAAGYTGRTVDDCEVNKNECYQANVIFPRQLAEICRLYDYKLIHMSSGCIFNGVGPFREEDTPNFISNWYQHCKWSAEQDILASGAKAWIFRIRMPFSWERHPRNWLTKLISYPKILDGLNSITDLEEFAMRSWQLAAKAPPGIYHAAYGQPVRTAEVAQMLWRAGVRKLPVEIYDPGQFAAEHLARSEAVLDVRKFELAYGTNFGDPFCGLRWYIANYGIGWNEPLRVPLNEKTPYEGNL